MEEDGHSPEKKYAKLAKLHNSNVHSIGLHSNGINNRMDNKDTASCSMYCWGKHTDGQLGLGGIEEEQIFSPRKLQSLEGRGGEDVGNKGVQSIACGGSHTMFLLWDGSLLSCGKNDDGQLGRNKSQKRPEPVEGLDTEITSVSCGASHTVALTQTGRVYAWGSIRSSSQTLQLGYATDDEDMSLLSKPKLVQALSSFRIIQVACGSHHVVVLRDNGDIYTWGCTESGALGTGPELARQSDLTATPQLLKSVRGIAVRQIAAGGGHSFILSRSGALFAWGKNTHGQLGTGDCSNKYHPVKLKTLKICYIACGEDHTVALTKDGGVFTCGAGMYGQLGHNAGSNELLMRQVVELMGSSVTQIACGRAHTLAYIASSRRLYAFGVAGNGQLGTGASVMCTSPHPVDTGSFLKPTAFYPQPPPTPRPPSSARKNPSTSRPLRSSVNHRINGARNNTAASSSSSSSLLSLSLSLSSTVLATVTGGDASFLVLAHSQGPPILGSDYRDVVPSTQIITLTTQCLDSYEQVPEKESDLDVMQEIQTIFSSASCLCSSLQLDSELHCHIKWHGVDLDAWKDAYARIHALPNTDLREYVYTVLSNDLVRDGLRKPPPDLEAMRVYLSLPLCEAFMDVERCKELICPFAHALLDMGERATTVMGEWWSHLKPSMFKRFVTIYKQAARHILFATRPNTEFEEMMKRARDDRERHILRAALYKAMVSQRDLKACMDVLKQLSAVNIKHQKIPYNQFYMEDLQEQVPIEQDYLNWLQQGQGRIRVISPGNATPGCMSFCDYPFVFNAEAKTKLLQLDAQVQMKSAVDETLRRNIMATLFSAPINPGNPHLVLCVDRNKLVESTLSELTANRHGKCDFKKPLKVQFVGEVGQDAGGVRKEFFMLLMKEVLDPKYGMFVEKASGFVWFNDQPFEDSDNFKLIGQLCGLAIYNSTIINLHFPLALYKKLLNKKLTEEDLQEMDPVLAKGLLDLLDYHAEPDDIADVFDLTFSVNKEQYGSVTEVELVPNGANIQVTAKNRKEFVDAYVDYIFNKSLEEQFMAFNDGFHNVVGGSVIEMFHPLELQAMVTGNEDYDWEELKKGTSYVGEYYANHPTIQMFWDVFMELTIQDKKQFLLFLTGSDRIPIYGMKALQIKLQPIRCGEDHLPVAHTCFNLLDLPIYTARETLRTKLLTAIQHSEGFWIA